jgi:hypothetical protein
MHWFEILMGTVFALSGLAALVGGLAGLIDRQFAKGLLGLSFGICFAVFGVLHFAEGVGAEWAPRVRSDVFIWFAIPCLMFWLLAWSAERRKMKR